MKCERTPGSRSDRGGVGEALTTRSRGGVTAGVDWARTQRSRADETVAGLIRVRRLGSRIPALEAAILDAAAGLLPGRRQASWSARLVAFHQVIWVGRPGMDVVSDVRKGCRMEVRAQRRTGTTARLRSRIGCSIRAIRHPLDRCSSRRSIAPRREVASAAFPEAGETIGRLCTRDCRDRCSRVDRARVGGRCRLPRTILDTERWAPMRTGESRRRGRSPSRAGGVARGRRGNRRAGGALIDRGQLTGFLLDRSTARVLARPSTGHGRRASHLDRIQPRMGCTYIEAGADDPSEILRSTDRGRVHPSPDRRSH